MRALVVYQLDSTSDADFGFYCKCLHTCAILMVAKCVLFYACNTMHIFIVNIN